MVTISMTQWGLGGLTTLFLLTLGMMAHWGVHRYGKRRSFHQKRIHYVQRSSQSLLVAVWLLVESFIFGVDLHGVNVLASSVFAVVGIAFFATWSVLSNITAAALIFFFFPYRIGDQVQIRDLEHPVSGQIVDMTLFWVKIAEDDGNLTCYPNNILLQKPITRLKDSQASDD